MSDDEAIDRLASDLEDRWREVATLSDSLVVGKFSNLPPTPERLLVAMSEALRLPHRLVEEIDVDWNDAVVTFSQECNSIGVFSCRLRCAAVAVEQLLADELPASARAELASRMFAATYLALEAVARRTASLLSDAAFHSDVCGLPNRRALENDLHEHASRDAEEVIHFVFIDMDGLKTLNDTLGHDAGDVALRSLTEALSSSVGASQRAYHLSGDEFALVDFEGGDPVDLAKQMESIFEKSPERFSYGIASLHDDTDDVHKLKDLADNRMKNQKIARRKEGKLAERGQ